MSLGRSTNGSASWCNSIATVRHRLRGNGCQLNPPLHGCHWATGGIGLGLADFFGAKLAEEWPDAKIGLIPNAIPGQLISIYLKQGGTQAPVPPGYANAYEMTLDRSRKAQEQGRIRAILMHQGESDDNQMMSDQWLGRVATVIADLRADLNLGEEVPFLAGQIGPSQWEKHNAYVDQIPDHVPNSAVISAEGILSSPMEDWRTRPSSSIVNAPHSSAMQA